MGSNTTYCQTRRGPLRSGAGFSRLATLTAHLSQLTGHDHGAFLETLDDCQTTARQLDESRIDLRSTSEIMAAEPTRWSFILTSP